MKRRKKKWPKGQKSKLYQGGVLNDRGIDTENVIPKIGRAGRTFTTSLVDKNDPYGLRGRY